MGNTVGDNVIVMNDGFPVNVVKENCCPGCTKNNAHEFGSRLNSDLCPVNTMVLPKRMLRFLVNNREFVPKT